MGEPGLVDPTKLAPQIMEKAAANLIRIQRHVPHLEFNEKELKAIAMMFSCIPLMEDDWPSP